MERMVLEARTRPAMSKGERRQMRSDDLIPAVIYGRGDDTFPLVIDGRTLRQVLNTGGSNVLVDLAVKARGKKTRQETVMFKEIQRDIIYQERILHVDFIRISMTDKIEVNVYLNFSGEPAGAAEGGVLSLVNREVQVRCLPGDIPEQFDVEISALEIGDSITAESLALKSGLELISAPDTVLAQVLAPMAEEVEPTDEEVGDEESVKKEPEAASAESEAAEDS